MDYFYSKITFEKAIFGRTYGILEDTSLVIEFDIPEKYLDDFKRLSSTGAICINIHTTKVNDKAIKREIIASHNFVQNRIQETLCKK